MEEREKEGFNKDRIMLYVKYIELFNFSRDTCISFLLVNIFKARSYWTTMTVLYFVVMNWLHRDQCWCILSSGIGAAPITDDKITNTNLYGANP